MGQYYNLINLDKRQSFSTFSSTAPDADGSYTLSFSNFHGGSKMWEKLMNKGEKPLLAMALTQLTFPATATGEDDNVKNPMAPMGSWSGDRIVIIGDYSEGFPPFFTPQDQQAYEAFYAAEEKDHTVDGEEQAEEADTPNLYSYASATYTAIPVGDFFKIENLGDQLNAQFPKQYRTHHLILNLDKNEYLDPVVCKSSTQEEDEDDGAGTAIATYVDAFAHQKDGIMQGLFSLLFYSNGSGGGDVDEFMKGRWAGNRISIQVKESVADLEKWMNISLEVEQELNSYLRNEQ
ncbi:hypothetical protein BGZ96_001977 [Linnemannia gamsii]|uniref:Uncharacterized protein n=1 Tax=Linnemannia gamsii TaxID=64522 RepID=A0ABQ7JLH7_9FUNG|nr:hypothetical protein BGZ96_001977 [Linnemannia gamsii]